MRSLFDELPEDSKDDKESSNDKKPSTKNNKRPSKPKKKSKQPEEKEVDNETDPKKSKGKCPSCACCYYCMMGGANTNGAVSAVSIPWTIAF